MPAYLQQYLESDNRQKVVNAAIDFILSEGYIVSGNGYGFYAIGRDRATCSLFSEAELCRFADHLQWNNAILWLEIAGCHVSQSNTKRPSWDIARPNGDSFNASESMVLAYAKIIEIDGGE